MSFFTSFGIIFMVMMALIFVLFLLLRFAKYGTALGSLAATLSGGHVIVDKSGMGSVAECVGWHRHPENNKIKLRLNFCEKFQEGQTPYIFDPEDFNPSLDQIDWEHYAGTIILHKDFEGEVDYRDAAATSHTQMIKKLRQQIVIYKRMGKSLLEYFEGTKITEAKEGQNLHNAKAYKVLKSLVDETNVDNVSPDDSNDPMFD